MRSLTSSSDVRRHVVRRYLKYSHVCHESSSSRRSYRFVKGAPAREEPSVTLPFGRSSHQGRTVRPILTARTIVASSLTNPCQYSAGRAWKIGSAVETVSTWLNAAAGTES